MRCNYHDGEKEQQELNIYRVVDTGKIPCGSTEQIEVEMFIIPKGQELYVPVTTTSKDNKQNKTNGFVVTAHLPARALVSNVTVYIASVGLGVEYVELECADEVGTPHPLSKRFGSLLSQG